MIFKDDTNTIVVRLGPDRELFYRFLTVGDEKFLVSLVEKDLPPRDLALSVLGNQELDDSPVKSADLDDASLAHSAFSWASQDQDLRGHWDPDASSLDDFKALIVGHVQAWKDWQQNFVERHFPGLRDARAKLMERSIIPMASSMFEAADATIRRIKANWQPIEDAATKTQKQLELISKMGAPHMQRYLKSLTEQSKLIRTALAPAAYDFSRINSYMKAAYESSGLIARLPHAASAMLVWEDAQRSVLMGEEVLREQDFRFAVSLANSSLLSDLAHAPDQLKGLKTVNSFLLITRTDAFHATLNERVAKSEVVRKRSDVLEAVYVAHYQRNYALSIPALFAQVEGMFTDSMILNGLASIRAGKILALNPDGTLKRNKQGKPCTLVGLGSKVQHSPYQVHAILQEVSAAFVDFLTGRRNGVLHGSDCRYARAKLSTQLVLLVFILATEILAFEEGRGPIA